MLKTGRVRRRWSGVGGGCALIAFSAVVAACGSGGQGPSTTTSTTTATTTPSVSAPTEKSVSPTGGNLFTPGVVAPSATNVGPGQHPGLNGAH